MHLKIGMILRISGAFHNCIYRIIAIPIDADVAFLYRLSEPDQNIQIEESHQTKENHAQRVGNLISVPTKLISAMADSLELENVEFKTNPKYLLSTDGLTEKERAVFDIRCKVARPFLDHELVCEALLSPRGIGKLVAETRRENTVSRATCYRLWELLCRYGFHLSSLNPRFDRCGGPGQLRPWEKGKPKSGRKTLNERLGTPETDPQVGITVEARQKILATYKVISRNPRLKFDAIYDSIIANCFIERFTDDLGVITPVTPPKGTYPNKEQVRRIVNQETNRLSRKLARTTLLHFNRNHRGLIGKSWQGIAGPGHVYAIDSTVGDIFLRSSVNRAWAIGRPIVYIIVDVWSTAIVGFYVCLSGPSWATAKVALFSTVATTNSSSDLWGIDAVAQLYPPPSLPHAFLCDRGEYLSKGAKETGELLGVNMQYNPSYRPDLKGIVEVLHRITKDQQFQFVPGAIDARRKEIELRANSRDGIFNLKEYVSYLSEVFAQYNFFSNRTERMNTDMIACGVDPSPAGLWRYGHEVGIGYQKEEHSTRLMAALLPTQEAAIRKDGVYLGGLKYEAPFVQEKMWPATARNFGVMTTHMHYFPGNNDRIWWPDPDTGAMASLSLSPDALAKPGISFDEWFDARAYDRAKRGEREHERNVSRFAKRERTSAMISKATEATRIADLNHDGSLPTLRDAKEIEANIHSISPDPSPIEQPVLVDAEESSDEVYGDLMAQLFSSENAEEDDHNAI